MILRATDDASKRSKSTNNNVVDAGKAEPFSGLFVKKIKIEILVRQPVGLVLDKGPLQPQSGELDRQVGFFGLDLDSAQMAVVALNRRKDEISR